MPFDPRLYPKEWRPDRLVRLKAVGGRCEGCGIADRAVTESAAGQPYMVYLSIAHRNQYETWKRDAETMVLCQKCHRRFDRQFRRKAGTRRSHTPIGYAAVYVSYEGRQTLVEMPRTQDDLMDVVSALPNDTEFVVAVVVLTQTVGVGRYWKAHNDAIVVEFEEGVCERLALQLEPLPKSGQRRL